MSERIIAIDPGREKCGLAVVDDELKVLEKEVVSTADLLIKVSEKVKRYQIHTIIIGDRTHSRTLQKELQKIADEGQTLTIIPVNEHRSSDEARTRYWQDHPPQGFKKLIPITLQTPPVPIDDYVAVILAERYFSSLFQKNEKSDSI